MPDQDLAGHPATPPRFSGSRGWHLLYTRCAFLAQPDRHILPPFETSRVLMTVTCGAVLPPLWPDGRTRPGPVWLGLRRLDLPGERLCGAGRPVVGRDHDAASTIGIAGANGAGDEARLPIDPQAGRQTRSTEAQRRFAGWQTGALRRAGNLGGCCLRCRSGKEATETGQESSQQGATRGFHDVSPVLKGEQRSKS